MSNDDQSTEGLEPGEFARALEFQDRIYGAIAVQRPIVLEYLRGLRRSKPNADAADLLKELDSRYVATVTATSTGVGASAAIPGVGIPIALGLGVADLLFFYETSALYVLAVAELHGVAVDDAERARPLVLGTLLGQKSQGQVSKLVLAAAGAGGVDQARSLATGVVAKTLPKGWGEVLTEQLPDSALAPLTVVIAREALKTSGKLGAGTLGKAVPFGVGAVIGGVGSFYFGRDVVKAARVAFPEPPRTFPAWLEQFEKPEKSLEPSRATKALHAASSSAKDFGDDVWGKVGKATEAFRSVDLDGDGIPDDPRALTAARGVGSAVAGAAGAVGDRAAAVGGRAASLFRRKPKSPGEDSATEPDADSNES
ncbi:hypothetical protein [Agrococcus jejuensis]|uniref:EcsC protein family protein n=1 Tax=Agrococcus jejuensis TaxID=399736 RepID=A0A1G8H3Q6_9MICO|nr:hypothetical protein [Agrococcus jejuensis]SDI01233.1 hypothetical protein SAMN04489720_3199 [Agrococcus jejuensis]